MIKSILLTGDMQFAEEELLMEADLIKHADILKAGNHGNSDASKKSFIDLIDPQIVVFTTDKGVLGEDSNTRSLYLSDKADEPYITKDFPVGVEITINNNHITVNSPVLKPNIEDESLEIATIDHKAEIISIKNTSTTAVNLSNCFLVSKRVVKYTIFLIISLLMLTKS